MNATDTNKNVTSIRVQAANLQLTLSKMNDLLLRWTSLDQSNTMDELLFTDDNEGILIVDLANFISTTTEALNTLMAGGHQTNIEKILQL